MAENESLTKALCILTEELINQMYLLRLEMKKLRTHQEEMETLFIDWSGELPEND